MKNAEVIRKYLDDFDMSVTDFAKLIKVTRATVHNILRKGIIRIDTAEKIQHNTNSHIKLSDFDIFWPAGKKPKNID